MTMPVYTYRAIHSNQVFHYTMTTLEAALSLARSDMERRPHQTFVPASIIHGDVTYGAEDIVNATEVDESVKIVEVK